MTGWLRWSAPPAIVLSLAGPAHAVQYMTVAQAQQAAFPAASQFVAANVIFKPADIQAIEQLSRQRVLTRGEQVWHAERDGQLLGYFILDYVIGKHEVIDYSVALDPTGTVMRVDILQYRESYGDEIRSPEWLAQFVGKTDRDPLKIDDDIRNISGATLSSRHVTEGVKRVLAIYETCIRAK